MSYALGMGIPDKKPPLIPKTVRLSDETFRKLDLMGKAGKRVNAWLRDIIDREVDAAFSRDRELIGRIQEIESQSSIL